MGYSPPSSRIQTPIHLTLIGVAVDSRCKKYGLKGGGGGILSFHTLIECDTLTSIMQRVLGQTYLDVGNIRDADLEAFFELLPSNGSQMDKECGCGGKNHRTCSQGDLQSRDCRSQNPRKTL